MSDGDEQPETAEAVDPVTGGPVDFARLDRIFDRLAGDERFIEIEREPAFAPGRLICRCDPNRYPT